MEITKQDVINHFKDANKVRDFYGDEAVIDSDFESRIYEGYCAFYMRVNDDIKTSSDILLYCKGIKTFAKKINNMEIKKLKDLAIKTRQQHKKISDIDKLVAKENDITIHYLNKIISNTTEAPKQETDHNKNLLNNIIKSYKKWI